MPSSGIMNTRSASDGMVWTTPTAASTTCPSRGRRAARTPSGSAHRIAATSETATSDRCSRARRHSAAARDSPTFAARTPKRWATNSAATDALGDPVDLGARVEAHHRRFVDLARHPPHRRERRRPARLGVAPVEQDRLVAREEAAIVGQHAQAVARDLGVGRIDVRDVQRAGSQAADRQLVVEALGLGLAAGRSARPDRAIRRAGAGTRC